MDQKDNTLDLLLKMEIQAPREQKVKIKRLSELCKKPVVFEVRQLSYNRIAEINKQHRQNGDYSVFVALAGTVSPNLKSPELLSKYNVLTPADLLKEMLLPGEIEDIRIVIEDLCGYREATLEYVDEVEKK